MSQVLLFDSWVVAVSQKRDVVRSEVNGPVKTRGSWRFTCEGRSFAGWVLLAGYL